MKKFGFVLVLVLVVWSQTIGSAAAAFTFNDSAFGRVWNRVDKPVQDLPNIGRGFTWGPPVIDSDLIRNEPYNGGLRPVQYWDKSRMEVNNPAADQNDLFYVTNGLLVKELVSGNRQDGDNIFTPLLPATQQVAGDPNDGDANQVAPTYATFRRIATLVGNERGSLSKIGSVINQRVDRNGIIVEFNPPEQRLIKAYDTTLQHNVPDVFVDFMNQRGPIWNGGAVVDGSVLYGNPIYVMGLPIAEAFWTRAIVAGAEKDVLVQLYERRVLTYTPSNPSGFKVEMGNVGQHYFKWRYKIHGDSNFFVPASIIPLTGTPQTAPVSASFDVPFKVQIKDGGGRAIKDIPVTFTAPGFGASGVFASGKISTTVNTDANGIVIAPTFTAGKTAGSYKLKVTTPGIAQPAEFTLGNTSGIPASLQIVAGSSPQLTKVNTKLTTPLSVLVRDVNSNPVSGVSVNFVSPGAGASGTFADSNPTNNVALTNDNGIATANAFTTNCSLGSFNIIAAVNGVSNNVNFAVTNLLGDAKNIKANVGANQTAKIATSYTIPLQALVTDTCGNPIDGSPVTFEAPSTGAGGVFQGANTVSTVGGGFANAPLLNANTTTGGFNVTARLNKNNATVTFSLSNTPEVATNIAASAGAGQITNANTAFATQLRATVTDTFGNPVSGVFVTFIAPASGIGGVFAGGSTAISATVTTNASGYAYAPPITAGCSPGSFNVVATTPGVANSANYNLTITPGIPSGLTAFEGTPQETTVSTSFTTTLKAKVTDGCGNPVTDSSVIFSIIPSPASATFSGIFTNAIGTTGVDGVASAPVLVANSVSGSFVVAGVSSAAGDSTNFNLQNKPGQPASIAVVSGDAQAAQINTAYSNPFMVKVKDAFGNPVQGAAVLFAPPSNGSSGKFAAGDFVSIETDVTGTATAPPFTANNRVGNFILVASISGAGFVNFNLTNNPGAAAAIRIVAGSGASAPTGTTYPIQLKARVVDAGDNPLPNIAVTFIAPNSGASGFFPGGVLTATATTDASGNAIAPVFTASGKAGAFEVEAVAVGVSSSVKFSLTNLPGSPTAIAVVDGTPQSIIVNNPFGTALKAKVTDVGNNPVPNVVVRFVSPNSGATAVFSGTLFDISVNTGLDGIASVPVITANSLIGTYNVTASVIGIAQQGIYTLTNTVGTPATIVPAPGSNGSGQTVQINTTYSLPLRAIVKDAAGNPVNGVSVIFTVPNNGASGTFPGGVISATVTADATGIATSPPLTSNNKAGGFNATATVSGVATPASFALTITPGAPVVIQAISGTPQSIKPNQTFTTPIQVRVTDVGNNPVQGVSITFSAPTAGPSGTFPGGVSNFSTATLADGTATAAALTANSLSGNFNLTAIAPTAGSVVFSLKILVGPPASIQNLTGTSPQSTVVDTNFATTLRLKVLDANGNAVEGATLNFTSATTASGAAATFVGPFVTDASGLLTVTARANQKAGGPYQATANIPAFPAVVPATYQLINTPGVPASITVISGSGQTANVGANFGAQLVATVFDVFSNPIPNVQVRFTAPATGATAGFPSASPFDVLSDANGQATVQPRANYFVGSLYNVTAFVVSNPAIVTNPAFVLSNSLGAGATISVPPTGGSGQSTGVYQNFAQPLQAAVFLAGNPVGGVVVNFAAPDPTTGASVSFPTGNNATTNAAGIASLNVTANGILGTGYIVTGTAVSVTGNALYSLSNNIPAGAQVVIVSGNGQTAAVGTAFAQPLVARVQTAGGQIIGNAIVTFNPPGAGASAVFPPVPPNNNSRTSDNATGIVSIGVAANAFFGGPYNVGATVVGIGTTNFNLTNGLPPGAVIEFVSGNNQNTDVLGTLAPIQVAVRASPGGTPIQGVTVNFAASVTPNTPTATFPSGNTDVTDAAGIANINTARANNWIGGPYIVTASVTGLTPLDITGLQNRLPNTATIQVFSGSGQTRNIGNNTAYTNPIVARVVVGGTGIGGVTVGFANATAGTFNITGGAANTDNNGQISRNVATNCFAFPATGAGSLPAGFGIVATITTPVVPAAPVPAPANFTMNINPGYNVAFEIPGALTAPRQAGGFAAFANVSLNLVVHVTTACGNAPDGLVVTYTIVNSTGIGLWFSGTGVNLGAAMNGTTNNFFAGTVPGQAAPDDATFGLNVVYRVFGAVGAFAQLQATVPGGLNTATKTYNIGP